MTRLIATTALSLALALPAAAQQGGLEIEGTFMETAGPTDFLAADLIGRDIFTAEREYEPGMDVAEDDMRQWEDAGEIEDVMFGADRRVKAVVVDVGGFLGVGDKKVAIQADDIRFVRDATSGERFVVFRSSREDLEEAPEFVGAAEVARAWAQRAASDPVTSDAVPALPVAANPEIDSEEFNEMGGQTQAQKLRMETDANQDAAPAPGEVERAGGVFAAAGAEERTVDRIVEPSDPDAVVVQAEPAMADAEVMEVDPNAEPGRLDLDRRMVTLGGGLEVSIERLEGAEVHGASGEEVGEITGFVDGPDGPAALIEIGGWLGVGGREVAAPMAAIRFRANDEGDEFSVYVNATDAELEAMEAYEG